MNESKDFIYVWDETLGWLSTYEKDEMKSKQNKNIEWLTANASVRRAPFQFDVSTILFIFNGWFKKIIHKHKDLMRVRLYILP